MDIRRHREGEGDEECYGDGDEEINECILHCKMYITQHAVPKEEIRKTSQNLEIFFLSILCSSPKKMTNTKPLHILKVSFCEILVCK
jgi:hypothetical protein